MRSLFTAPGLIILLTAGIVIGEVVPPADVMEPVRLTLEECIKLGLEQNPEIGVKEAGVDQARGQLVQAKANKLPQFTLSGNVVRSNKLPDFTTSDATLYPTSFGFANPGGGIVPGLPDHIHMLAFPGFEISNTREGDIYGVKVEGQYALYAGGRIKNGIKAAELNQDVASQDLRQKRNELVFNITQTFYGVLMSQEQVKLLDEAYATAEAHYRQVKAFYNEGLASSLDVLQVESALAGIRPRQIEANNGLELAKLYLKSLLNLDLDVPIEAVGSLEYESRDLPLPEDLYAEALGNRPEVRIMGLRGRMAERMLDIAKANAYPTVGLFANYSWDRGQEMPPNDKIWRDGWQAGAAVSVPLYDGRATQGKVAEAAAQVSQVEHGKRALEQGVKTQVQQSVLNLRAAEQKIEAEKASVSAARKNYNTAKARYAVGLATNLDVMDANNQLTQAKVMHLAAIYDYNMAWAQLQAALGKPETR